MHSEEDGEFVDCFLCAAQAGGADLRWHDRPIRLAPCAGLVVAGLGGLAPGYVLIASSEHRRNLRCAVRSQPAGFLDFLLGALALVEQKVGELTFWEHGAPAALRRRSACIDHAHLHVVPGSLALPAPGESTLYPNIEAALSATSDELGGYLLLGWSRGEVMVGEDPMVSQYYRREWARLLGREDEWDYLVAEKAEITAATMRLFDAGRC